MAQMLLGGLLMWAHGFGPYTRALRLYLMMEQLQILTALVGLGVGASGLASMGYPPSAIITTGFLLIAAILAWGGLKDTAKRCQADRDALQADRRMLHEKHAAAQRVAQQLPANSSPAAAATAVAELALATLLKLQ